MEAIEEKPLARTSIMVDMQFKEKMNATKTKLEQIIGTNLSEQNF
jgi:hypothetical protein